MNTFFRDGLSKASCSGKRNVVVASAQMVPERENVPGNIEKHIHFIKTASKYGTDLVLFPEMSLTGYERELAYHQAFHPDDDRLSRIRMAVAEGRLTAVVGAPLILGEKLHIGLFILQPSGEVQTYTKQYLHSGEELFFSPRAEHDPALVIGTETISFAVCYDIENPDHPLQAFRKKSTIYAASIFYSLTGIAHGHEVLQKYAREYSMSVLMSNFCGKCWDIDSGGHSVFFASGGEKIAECSALQEEILIARNVEGIWTGECIPV